MRLLILIFISLSAIPDELISSEFILPTRQCTPGQVKQIVIKTTIKEGWHTYWLNPGESGLSPEFEVTGKYFKLLKVHFPTPEYYKKSGIVNYIYKNEVLFIVDLFIDKDAPKGKFKISGSADFLVCKDSCIPQSNNFEAEINIDPSKQKQSQKIYPVLEKAQNKMPQKLEYLKKKSKNGNYEIFLPKNFKYNKDSFFAFFEDGLIPNEIKIHNSKLSFKAEVIDNFSGLIITGKTGYVIE
jgi:thiol:disulfide interchange protein DsbD